MNVFVKTNPIFNTTFQVFNVLKSGMVNQDEINVPPFKPLQQIYHAVENCNYCITLGSELGFVLVGIEG